MVTLIVSASRLGFIECVSGPSRTARSFSSSLRLEARQSNHYEKLKVAKTATKAQVKARFYELSKKHHPDAPGGDASVFHEISNAYSVLGNESKRRQYDQSLVAAANPTSSSPWSPRSPGARPSSQGPHRAWGGGSSSSSNSQRRPPPPPQYPYHNTLGGRRVPPSFGSASHHPGVRRSGATGPMGDVPRPGQEHEAVQGGESGVLRFFMTAGLVMTVVWLGGGFTASAEELERVGERGRRDLDRRLRAMETLGKS